MGAKRSTHEMIISAGMIENVAPNIVNIGPITMGGYVDFCPFLLRKPRDIDMTLGERERRVVIANIEDVELPKKEQVVSILETVNSSQGVHRG